MTLTVKLRRWYRKVLPEEVRYLLYQARGWLKLAWQKEWKRCWILGEAILIRTWDDLELMRHNQKKVECPMCGWSGNCFFVLTNMGHNLWRAVLCPKCNCLDRHRLLFTYLKNKLNLDRTARILDVAPMQGIQNYFKQFSGGTYVGIDLVALRAGVKIDAQMSVTALGLADNSFDLVICYHVLEHVQDDQKGICELARVLKSSGLAVFDVPLDWDSPQTVEFASPEEIHGHYRTYGKDFLDRLRNSGFDVLVEDFKFAWTIDPSIKRRYGLPTWYLIPARTRANCNRYDQSEMTDPLSAPGGSA